MESRPARSSISEVGADPLLDPFNPMTYIVDGVRAIFRGDIMTSEAAVGFAVTAALVLIGVYFATRMFKNESA